MAVVKKALAFASIALWACAASAQTYPAKTIRVIVPQSSGSVSDTVARVVGQRMSALLGQTLVIDNRAGAGGLTGAEIAAKAPGDGYTLFIASISSHGTVPALYRKLSFDPVKDFSPVSLCATTPNVLVVHPSLPVHSTKELIALAKARPGQLNVGSQGNGSSQHLATELFKIMGGGLNAVHVPYKGSGPAITALLTGEISFLMPTLALSTPHIQSGRPRAIAVTTLTRLDEWPNLPTVAEALPGFEVLSWIGLLASGAPPKDVIGRLNDAAAKALAMAEVRKSFTAVGMTPAPGTPEQFGAYIEKEIAKWTKVARAAKIEAD